MSIQSKNNVQSSMNRALGNLGTYRFEMRFDMPKGLTDMPKDFRKEMNNTFGITYGLTDMPKDFRKEMNNKFGGISIVL